MESNTRFESVENELKELKNEIKELKEQRSKSDKVPIEKLAKKEKKPRAPSAYNNYVKEFISEQKKIQGDDFKHKVAFGLAAKEWSKNKSVK